MGCAYSRIVERDVVDIDVLDDAVANVNITQAVLDGNAHSYSPTY